MSHGHARKRPFWKDFVGGACGGIADVWSCHGLDRVKTHIQNNPHMSMSSAFRDIWAKGGLPALYEGVLPMTVEAITKVGLRFVTYEYGVHQYKKFYDLQSETYGSRLFGAFFAGTIESYVIVIPCELLKVRHMTQAGHESFMSVFQKTLKTDGFLGLYKGGTATYLRQVTNQMIRFPIVYGLAEYIKKENNGQISPVQHFAAGGFAGIVSTYLNTPLDTLKTRMQSQGAQGGVMSAVSAIYQQKGVFGFWAGVVPRMIRVAPGQAITFAVAEAVKTRLDSVDF